jgi:hypothetical protein
VRAHINIASVFVFGLSQMRQTNYSQDKQTGLDTGDSYVSDLQKHGNIETVCD